MDGYFKVHRKILESQVFAHPTALKIWIWCLAKVTFKDRFLSLKIGKGEIIIKLLPGQFIFGRFKAEEELNIDGSTIYKWIQKFASPEFDMILIESNNQYSVITLTNWKEYQNENDEEVTTIEQPNNNHVTTKEQPCNTNKKDKNVKNEEELKKRTQIFKESVLIFKDQYSDVILTGFFDYWSESNKSKTKMLFEMKPTFELSKRLATWQRNDDKFGKNKKEKQIIPQFFSGPKK